MGGQDDFPYAERFVSDTGVTTPTMLWDPSFQTWTRYNVNRNSDIILLNAALTGGSEPRPFDTDWILNNLPQFSS